MGRRGRHAWILVVLAAWIGSPASADGLAVVDWHLEDNGDDDGYADTRETVTVRLTVRNTTAAG